MMPASSVTLVVWAAVIALAPSLVRAQRVGPPDRAPRPASRPAAPATQGTTSQGPTTQGKVELRKDWAERDFEGKWVVYRADRDRHSQDADRLNGWVSVLVVAKDFEFLEWIAIYEGWRAVGPALVQAGAPQWARVAVWNIDSYDSHNKDGARKVLNERAEIVLGWFEKFPIAQRGKGSSLYRELTDRGVVAGDSGELLPPFDGTQILLPYLDVPPTLEEFGDRRRAEPRKRYVHQVLRALNGLAVWGGMEAPHVSKVLALTRHGDRRIRNQAYTTLTKLPGHLVPRERLLAAANAEGPEADRRLAFMAYSYSPHPSVWLHLHAVARDPAHFAVDLARSRLVDVGDSYTVAALAGAEWPTRDERKALRLSEVTKQIAGRIQGGSQIAALPGFRAAVERVAWARSAGHADAAALETWLRDAAAALGARLPEVKEELADRYEPSPVFRGQEAKGVARAVRELLSALKTRGDR